MTHHVPAIYNLIKWLHIIFAIAAIGANITYGIWIAMALPFTLRTIKLIDDRLANPSYGMLLVTGVVMLLSEPFDFGTPWVSLSLGLYVLAVLLGIFGYSPALRWQIALAESDGPGTAEYGAAARRGTVMGILLVVLVVGCAPASRAPAEPRTLTVFAAASLTSAFTELGQQFEAANPGVVVVFNFGASNALAQQLNQGAPADVFASANEAQMEAAVAAGRVDAGAAQVFARNRLLVIFPRANPGGVAALADLARPGLKLVLAAPEVPVGQYTLDFLDKAAQDPTLGAGYPAAGLANVVSYEENVRAVFAKVALGEADAGIVYASDVIGDGAANVDRLDIPDALNTMATYPLAPLSDSAQPALAGAFIELVLSPEGQAVLAGYGFVTGE